MVKAAVPLLALLLASAAGPAFANNAYQTLPFSQDWSNAALITAPDDWSGVSGIIGYRGDDLVTTTGVDPRTVLADDPLQVVDVIENQTNPLTLMTGGVAEFQSPADAVVGLNGSGTADAPYLVLHLDTRLMTNIHVSYLAKDLEGAGSVDNAVQPLAMHYRVGTSGAWTNVPAGYVADATTGPGTAIATMVSATLPLAAENQAFLQVRIMTTNAAGNDEWVGIDNISVTGTLAEVLFVDHTGGLSGGGNWWGCAWADADVDGDLDVFVSNNGGPNRLGRNNGGGNLGPVTPVVLVDGANNSVGVGWGDYDNDGLPDLYVVADNGPNRLFHNTGGLTFADETPAALAGGVPARAAAWADYDNDGDLDLYIGNIFGNANKLVRNDEGAGFVDVTHGPLGNTGDVRSVVWFDFDLDGDQDIFLSNSGQANKLFRNDAATFVDVTPAVIGFFAASNGAAAADWDDDGDPDLVITIYGSSSRLLRNDGGNLWVSSTPTALTGMDASLSVAWADYDNDGRLDLYRTGDANELFRNLGGGVFDDVTPPVIAFLGNSEQAAWADYDGDGDLDLWVSVYGGNSHLFRNDTPTSNHWLNLDLEGVHSNRSAIGARVRAVAGGNAWTRWVGMGTGQSHGSLTVEFGLGAATEVDTLQIRWPSGVRQDTAHVAVDQLLRVIEHDSNVGVGGPVATTLTFSGVFPNPSAGHARIDYTLPAETRVRLTVHDLQGRRVATLVDGVEPAGRRSATWEAGALRGIAAGVYVARLEALGEVRTRKLALTR